MARITIDGKEYQVEQGQSVLEAALENGIEIPHLCYHEALSPYGGCRLCLVEITRNGRTLMTTSCTYPCLEGIAVRTETADILKARRLILELLLPLAPEAPRLQALARQLGVAQSRFAAGEEVDHCIRCGLCLRACTELVGAQAIAFSGRGYRRKVEPPFGEEAQNCIGCGTCAHLCPTGCIEMEDRHGVRRLDRWKRTLPLAVCSGCGRSYLTLAEIEFARGRAQQPPAEDWFDLCPDCR